MRDLWRRKWHRGKFSFEYFRFTRSLPSVLHTYNTDAAHTYQLTGSLLLLNLIRATWPVHLVLLYLFILLVFRGRSQWPRGLRCRSAAARHMRLWVRIPRGAWMSVCCECCMLSGRGLCDGLITRPEESYRLRYVAVCDLETS